MPERFSVSLSHVLVGEKQATQIKLQSDDCELNVLLNSDELLKLQEITNAKWSTRNSVKLGTCLKTSVYWSHEDGLVSVLVGEDDEVWEVGMTFPEAVFVELEQQAARLQEVG